PTLLEAAGVQIPKEMQGASLLPLMSSVAGKENQSAGWRERPAYSESEYPRLYGWSALRSLRTDKYLYIQAPHRQLYDPSAQPADPNAAHNLDASSSAIADTLSGQLQALRKRTLSAREAPKSNLDPEAQAKLGALGYMAASASAKSNSDDGPDPKDKIEIANL